MPELYTENSEKWKALADIDYFTQFAKVWIPFNAWYRNYYPGLKREREIIDTIKSSTNSFRSRLISLLPSTNTNNEALVFRSHVAQLHYELERKHVHNSGKRITFEDIVVEINIKNLETFQRFGLTYRAERQIAGHPKQEVHTILQPSQGVARYSLIQPNGFNRAEMEAHNQFAQLSPNQQVNLRKCYAEIDPCKPLSLLSNDPNECIMMDTYQFINDIDLLSKGIIEILYKLRNSLFHGEIIPDKDTNKVYGPTYQVLHMLIQAL